ncbi:MAG: hypothetical protein JSS66_15370 [Armatimonadetes bacterium]|nr:hypothetical protein [Armatimonadota bacterium]
MSHLKVAAPALVIALAVLAPALFARNAAAQLGGQTPAYVRLQNSSPGSPQTGHANITGVMTAGQFVGGGAALTSLSANNVSNGLLGPAFGGTGINTISTPSGSLLRTTAPGTWSTLPIGGEGQVLKSTAGLPTWGPDGLQLPFSATVSSGVAMTITQNGTLDVYDANIVNSASAAECFQGGSNGFGDVVQATMLGLGRAGSFSVLNSANAASAVETSSNGTGYGLKVTMTGTGAAAHFAAATPGTSVEVCSQTAAVKTTGYYYRDYTPNQPSAAVPIAYGSISSTGAVSGGTGNFSVTHTVTGDYNVTINGEAYSNTAFTVSVLPISNAPRMACIVDGGTPFLLHIFDQTGTKVDTGFQFTVWRADEPDH